MTEVDFAIAIGMTIAIVSFIIFYAVGDFDQEISGVRSGQLDYVKASLSDQILDGYLSESMKKVNMMFEEAGDYSHTETMKISLYPPDAADSIHAYNDRSDEISSSISYNPGNITVSFSRSFSAGEKKYVSIIYKGSSTSSMSYDSNITQTNITGLILSEHEIPVISYERCSSLSEMDYDDFRDELGTDHYFQLELTDCDFGPEPPDTDVAVYRASVMREDISGSVLPDTAVLRVWL